MCDKASCCQRVGAPRKLVSLEDLKAELRRVFEAEDGKVDVELIKSLLGAYKSNREDWKQYAKFDAHRYTRNLVDEGNGRYNLIALCWDKGHGSAIHNHSDAHCCVKVLDGHLKETQFAWPDPSAGEAKMVQTKETTYPTDGVTYINDSIGLHRMENPSNTEPCVSLHLYWPPFLTCKTFDDNTGHQSEATMTFYSKYGKRTDETAEGNQCSEYRCSK